MNKTIALITLPAVLISIFYLQAAAFSEESPVVLYELALSFDLDTKLLTGTAHIVIPPGEDLSIYLGEITPTAALLQKGSAAPGIMSLAGHHTINVLPDNIQQELYISYEKHIVGQGDNFITERGITLLQHWYPQPSQKVRFSLSATLPAGFTAFSASDSPPMIEGDVTKFFFSPPVNSLHFVAAPFVVDSLEVRPDLMLYTYFFPEDRDLAPEYLQAARDFILRYEKLIGPYPYNHFAIVANQRPTGYGMPTFTLLGQNVLRLPFIKNISLGHEILHSWFGNAIEVPPSSANWSEGLTTYLADWLYRVDLQEGDIARKGNIIKFDSFVTKENAVPLQSFTSANHYQPMAQTLRSIGYIKGAMVFHELKNYVGENVFSEAIKRFYSLYKGKEAEWQDIREVFEELSSLDLIAFFEERLTRTDIPDIKVEDISVTPANGGFILKFKLLQQTEKPFHMMLPGKVKTSAGLQNFKVQVSAGAEQVELLLDSTPFELILDPEYDLLRQLKPEEMVPVWSLFQGPAGATVVVSREDKEMFSPFLDSFSAEGKWQIVEEEYFRPDQAGDTNLILLGRHNRISRSYFGEVDHPLEGLTLEGRPHPLIKGRSVLLVSGSNAEEVAKGVAKLPHYGRYNFLHFRNGMAANTLSSPGTMGQRFPLAVEPTAHPAAAILPLDAAIEQMSTAKVIYLGETHTAMTDHFLQYLILEGIFRRNPNIAIGLEMFPKSSQRSLDQYTQSEIPMDEKLFLKQSRYFEVWGYDYRYYKNIIDFAKNQRLPLIGLNVDKNLVSTISRQGSADTLSAKEKQDLPPNRDLSLPGYRERLTAIYTIHRQGGHGTGSLSGFIQAQAVWDEAMAANIVEFLQDNPDKQLVVLAGVQHVRKDSGIPPRVKRRYDVSQKVVLTENHFSARSPALADFYFSVETQPLPAAGRIGISLEEKGKNSDTYVEIISLTPTSKASTSGLQPGDRIVSVNGYDITALEDVKIAMLGAMPGEIAEIIVQRVAGQDQMKSFAYMVELSPPANPH
jgi:aminopeptidase N